MKKRGFTAILLALLFFSLYGSTYEKRELEKRLKVIYKDISTGEDIKGAQFIVESPNTARKSINANDYSDALKLLRVSEWYESSPLIKTANIEESVYPCVPSGYVLENTSESVSDVLTEEGRELTYYFKKVEGEEFNLNFYDPRLDLSLDGGIFKLFNENSKSAYYCETPAVINNDIKAEYRKGVIIKLPLGYKTDESIMSFNSDNSINIMLQADEIPLHFYCEIPSPIATDDVKGDYTAIRIGEYLWTTSNFNHDIPHRKVYWYDQITFPHWPYGALFFGHQSEAPVTQGTLNRYMPCLLMNPSSYQLADINNFKKYYGAYYNYNDVQYMGGFRDPHTGQYRAGYGRMKEGVTQEIKPWRIPSQAAFAQLFAMCEVTGGYLHEQAVEIDLGAKIGDNPLAFHISSNGQVVGWFDAARNKYGFNLMPSGGRIAVDNEVWCNGLGCWDGKYGDLYHLFHAEYFHTMEDDGQILCIGMHDYLTFYRYNSSKWQNIRYSRRLTDEELGYKLYINEEQTDIKKMRLDEQPPIGYYELPAGYLRGFYIQYMLNRSDALTTVNDLIALVKNTAKHNTSSEGLGYPLSEIVEIDPVGIEENEVDPESEIEISYVQNHIKIAGEFLSANLIDLNGRSLLKTTEADINISSFSGGVYIIHVVLNNGKSVNQKIIK